MKRIPAWYLSRNGESHGGSYCLSTYQPRRNPQYDKFKCSDGTTRTQEQAGSWYFWPNKADISFTLHMSAEEALNLLNGKHLEIGQCVNLVNGEIINLSDAPAIRIKRLKSPKH